MKSKNEIRQEELEKALTKETSPPAINVLVSMLEENKLAVKNEREEVLEELLKIGRTNKHKTFFEIPMGNFLLFKQKLEKGK